MLVVVALGDGAVRPRVGPVDAEAQADAVTDAARRLAALAHEHHLVVVHGFGPADAPGSPAGAGPAGFEAAMACQLPADRVATVPTRLVVGAGNGTFRPRSIVDLRTFRILVDGGVTVLCPGDACTPVERTPTGGLWPVDTVIDGELAATRLAIELDADALVLIHDADGDPPDDTDGAGLRAGALRDFVAAGGWLGAAGPLADVAAMARGEAGEVVWGPDASAVTDARS